MRKWIKWIYTDVKDGKCDNSWNWNLIISQLKYNAQFDQKKNKKEKEDICSKIKIFTAQISKY